jgi:hypothetical protein
MESMKALVVYESMFGNTRRVAEAIGAGLAPLGEVSVVQVADACHALVTPPDLVVVGGPTHGHGMSRPKSRAGALDVAHKPASDLVLEPQADGPGVREWLADLPRTAAWGAAFDTRMTMASFLTGRASRRIHARLRRRGLSMVVGPASFLVDGRHHLLAGEEDRARAWGARLAQMVDASRVSSA